ncbi:unnamed protein product, partial [marine sediment metagenome]
PNTNMWTITYDEKWDQFHLIHKLGYIWLWKKCNHLDFIKKKWFTKEYWTNGFVIKELREFEGTVMDAISYFTLADMDLDFRKEYIDYHLNLMLHAYNGHIPDHTPTKNRIQLYVYTYLIIFYFFPDFIRYKHEIIFDYLINNLQKQIMEGSRKEEYPLTREIFNDLRTVLNDFDSVMKSRNYRDVIDFSLQIADVFPYWNREYLIKQFNVFYSN